MPALNLNDFTPLFYLVRVLEFVENVQKGIAERLNLEKVHLAIVPGNHDCTLGSENAARTRIIELLSKNHEDAKEDTIIDICISAQENFFYFMHSLETQYLNQNGYLYYEYSFPFESNEVVFRCLNTAWVSQLHEREGTMIYPVDIVPVRADQEAAVVITMLHHPYNWLGNENARALRDRLESNSDIILTGHEHVGSRYQKVTAHGPLNEYLEGWVLQDNYKDESSHFSVIELDLEAKKQKITHFSYLDNLYRPTDSSDTAWASLQVNQLQSQRKFKFNLNFERYLDDPEATFTSSKGDLGLKDLYVHPMLQEQNFDNKGKETFRSHDLPIRLLDSPHIVISGSNHSGKTALAKILCQSCLNEGLVPILLEGNNISDPNESRIMNQIYRTFSSQYDESVLEEFKQLPPSKKIVILDDYAKLRLNTKGRKKLLETLNREFTYIVLFADDFAMRLDEIVHHNGDSLMRSFSRFRILEFGYKLRDEMAMRWLRPEDDYTTDLQQLSRRLKHVRDVLDTVLGRNFIPSYPFFLSTRQI